VSARAARLWCTALLLLLAAYMGTAASVPDVWPLGPGASPASGPARAAAALVGLLLGWVLPGVPLTFLAGGPARLFWPRALGLGTGYVLATSGAYAAAVGHLPSRAAQVVLLALPCLAALVRSREVALSSRSLASVLGGALLLAALLWPKLAHEALNGDGTESYELARSLSAFALPHWDMERPEGGGRFGIPAVNPFITNSYLAGVRLSLMGTGEIAVRLTLVGALIACLAIPVSSAARAAGGPAWIYAGALTALHALWGAYYVGYERAFTDLAEPLGTDTLMTALWLAGWAELVAGSAALGVSFLFLASGVLYSAPVLATVALVTLAVRGEPSGRRALRLWIGAGVALAVIVLGIGVFTGEVGDWVRQVRSEYWSDFVDQSRRTPTLPILGLLALATGGLPVVACVRGRRLSPSSQALLATSAAYIALIAASRYKNLHYLAPLPFLLAGPAIEATGRRLQLAAAAVLALAFALSWPDTRAIHRENAALGEAACLGDGIDVATASLGGDVVYAAFAPPGAGPRFGIGKHTFARYAAALGTDDRCVLRLGRVVPEGWIPLASRHEEPALTLSTRDLDAYVQWRFRTPPMPGSFLFPAPVPAPIPLDAAAWTGRLPFAHGEALLVDGFRPEPPGRVGVRGWPLRLLVSVVSGDAPRWRTWAPEGGHTLSVRVNDAPSGEIQVAPGWSEGTLAPSGVRWRQGWSLVALTSSRPDAPLTIEWLEMNVPRAGEGSR
jgi:hypothetical protein